MKSFSQSIESRVQQTVEINKIQPVAQSILQLNPFHLGRHLGRALKRKQQGYQEVPQKDSY